MIWEGNPEYSAAPFLDARKNRASKKLMNRHESIEKTTQVQKKRANGARSVSFLCFFFLNWILDTFWFPDVTVSSVHILMYSPSCKNNMVLANSCYRAWSTCNLLGGYWFTGKRSHCSVRAVSKYFMPFILFINFFTYLIFPFLENVLLAWKWLKKCSQSEIKTQIWTTVIHQELKRSRRTLCLDWVRLNDWTKTLEKF